MAAAAGPERDNVNGHQRSHHGLGLNGHYLAAYLALLSASTTAK